MATKSLLIPLLLLRMAAETPLLFRLLTCMVNHESHDERYKGRQEQHFCQQEEPWSYLACSPLKRVATDIAERLAIPRWEPDKHVPSLKQ